MAVVGVRCLRCNQPVPREIAAGNFSEFRCPACRAQQLQIVYPVFLHEDTVPDAPAAPDDSASCYFHQGVTAENLCDDCGRYLCQLCTVPIPMPASEPAGFPNQVCPACLQNRVDEEETDGGWDLFRTRYPRYDQTVFALVVFPIVAFPLAITSLVTCPIAIYLAIRYGRRCRSPLQSYHKRMLLAAALAVMGIVFWTSILAFSLVNAL